MPLQTELPVPGTCPDALACPHEASEPTGDYLRAKAHLQVAAIAAAFPGLPRAHLNAIWRARQEFPEKRQQTRQLLWSRRWLRRR